VQRIKSGDIQTDEHVVGVGDLDSPLAKQLSDNGVKPQGVKAACAEAVKRINSQLKLKG
jgi:hypothetical protein